MVIVGLINEMFVWEYVPLNYIYILLITKEIDVLFFYL